MPIAAHPTAQADADFDPDENYTCQNCGGEGFIVTCVDDLCHSGSGCIHGDGEETCPECHGTGETAL